MSEVDEIWRAKLGYFKSIELNQHSPDERLVRPSLSSIAQEPVEKCEIVHT
jgi:hypothetical protein